MMQIRTRLSADMTRTPVWQANQVPSLPPEPVPPPIVEPEPDRLPDEEPNPNDDENEKPPVQ